MHTGVVRRRGDGLWLTFPKHIVKGCGFKEGDNLRLRVKDGVVIATLAARRLKNPKA
jgi:antitoxin component of MazEF toxin-antitoxin module